MSRRHKRSAKRQFYCTFHKKAFTGLQWGGHRRVCQAPGFEVKPRDNRIPPSLGKPVKPPIAAPAAPPPAVVKTTAADQVVKTVRSYLSSIEEERSRVVGRLAELGEEVTKLTKRQLELDNERAKIISSFKDLK